VRSTATLPPAFSTAVTSCGLTLKRPSSRAKKATVVSGPMPAIAGSRCVAISVSFQRSAPSTMRKRRPIANVIAASAPATMSGAA